MQTTKVSSKGRIVIPKSVRDARHWHPGTKLVVEERPEGVLLRRVKPFAPTAFEQAEGILKYRGRPKTLQEMDEGITKAIRERHARGEY